MKLAGKWCRKERGLYFSPSFRRYSNSVGRPNQNFAILPALNFCETRANGIGKTTGVLQQAIPAPPTSAEQNEKPHVQNGRGFAPEKHFCRPFAKVQKPNFNLF